MAETKRIARGTDATLIAVGIALVLAAVAWDRYGSRPDYAPWFTPVLATAGVVLVATGLGIIAYAWRRYGHRHWRLD